jgi:hypothetical protein
MRRTLLAGFIWAAAAGVALAQYGGARSDQHHQSSNSSQSRSGRGHDDTPEPPPLPRCADLGIASYAFVSAIPGATPLAGDEVALQWDVHNGGNSAYTASSAQAQSLTLEYSTPSGPHQIASMAVPAQGGPTTTAAAAGPVALAPGQSWRGYMRATLSPDARRWQLRLKLTYAAATSVYAAPVSDCDSVNNEITLARPF